MIDVLKILIQTIIETIVLTPILIVSMILCIIAIMIYPIKNVRIWIAKQAIRILDMWNYYVNSKDVY